MKKLLMILCMVLFSTMIFANPFGKTDYIITKDGKYISADVQLGILKIHAKQIDGNKIKINYSDVLTYQKDGNIYTKKPLYDGKINTGSYFMKLVSWRNGLSLYCFDNNVEKRYFIFKDENILWLEVEQKNAETINKFFNKI